MAAAAPSISRKDYIKDEALAEGAKGKTKKKRKEKKTADSKPLPGVLVVDEDPIWQKPIEVFEDARESSGDEMVQVEEDVEVKRMKRLEAMRSQKPYHSISQDGSGWVAVNLSPPRLGSTAAQCNDVPPSEFDENRDNEGVVAAEDLSPPRRRRNGFPEPRRADLSPPRKSRRLSGPSSWPPLEADKITGVSEDLSPPRMPRRNLSPRLSEADLSPHRRSRRVSESLSPSARDLSPPRKKRDPSTVKGAQKFGLLLGKELKEDNEREKKEGKLRYAEMDPSLTGRGAEVVYRNKGRLISKEEMVKSKVKEKSKEKKLEWGKGLAQKHEAEEKAKEVELEKEKPFARSRDDPDLEKLLKERVRWGDPMAHLLKRKEADFGLKDLGIDEKMKESGFIIPQTIPNHSWLKCGLNFSPNRYGIRPGRHWDGVDRSTGFENELFKRQCEKQAMQTEAYLWSVADM